MPKVVRPLTDTEVKNAKADTEKDFHLSDGSGLSLLVTKDGGKYWRFNYISPVDGKRKLISFGTYPDTTLAKARELRLEARQNIAYGIDASTKRKEVKEAKKQAVEAAKKKAQTFEVVFYQWVEVKRKKITDKSIQKLKRTFELYLIPFIGKKPIDEITRQEYTDLILRMRDKGIHYYAHKTKGILQQFLNYLEEANILENAPRLRLENALPKPKETNYPHITDLKQLGELLRAIDGYAGDISTKRALQLAPYVFLRPANIRFMEWSEIDFEKAIWRIPADKMKMDAPHIVPLSRQALEIIKSMQPITGRYKYVFVSSVSTLKPLSENTLNMGLMRLGYKDRMVSHGFRHNNALRVKLAMKRYVLNIDNANAEVLKWLDERANARIHQTTLQRPFELLSIERPYLNSVPKPYMGISPRVLIKSVSNKTSQIKQAAPIIYIPPRDIGSYDNLIPQVAAIIPMFAVYGGLLCR